MYAVSFLIFGLPRFGRPRDIQCAIRGSQATWGQESEEEHNDWRLCQEESAGRDGIDIIPDRPAARAEAVRCDPRRISGGAILVADRQAGRHGPQPNRQRRASP